MDKKNKITNINARADEELLHECECAHDPLLCNEGIKSEIRIYRAMDVLSEVISDLELDYIELCEVFGRLTHYYENVAEISGVDTDELRGLPPIMFDESDFD